MTLQTQEPFDADAALNPEQVAGITQQLADLDQYELALLKWRLEWNAQARPSQLAPVGDWTSWGCMAGRGWGKTRVGANWIGIEAASDPGSFSGVIAPTRDDVRYVCFEGETGIFAYLPDILIADYNKSDLIIYLWNGSIIRGFGSERPERLRGPQHHRVWCDEVAAWQYAKKCWDMMQFGLRLGQQTRIVWTTTPKPVPIIKERVVEQDTKHLITKGTTYENKANLSTKFYEEVAKYEGTKIGRQELHGELIDPEESGIVKRSQWKLWPAKSKLPRFVHIVMSLDTAYTERTFDTEELQSDPTACLVWGLFYVGPKLCVMLLDAWDDHLGLPALIKRVKEEARVTYGMADEAVITPMIVPSAAQLGTQGVMVGRPIDVMLIEDKGSGISLRQMMGMENVLMTPFNPGRADKLARLHAITPMFAHGRVYAVESERFPGQPRNWADPAISQICSYHGPGTTEHDDYLDAMTQALNYFMRRFIHTFVELTPEEKQEREENERLGPARASGGSNPYAN